MTSNENKPILPLYQIVFYTLFLIVLILFVTKIAYWLSYDEEAQDKTIELLESKTEKEKIVADIKHEVLKWPKYTIRLGYEWTRKPIPKLSGLTKDERAKQLLDTVGIGHTLPIWKKLGEKYEIDYTLPLSIGFADSHLWKALKSKNNIGNIWNNDRGDTKNFDSLEAWIEAIFWTLAHWKYMSGHNTIWTLSGEGRKRLNLKWCSEEKDHRKKCYASSMGVWSTNVVNIMSALHDKQIDETFEFRIK